MTYYIYKIVNNKNSKFYYGVRKCPKGCSPENDEYYGSGKAIKDSIKLHGLGVFSKTIVKVFEKKEDAYEYEKQIVSLQEVRDQNCYNMRIGGSGGGMPGELNHNYGMNHSEQTKKIISEKAKARWTSGKYENAKKIWSENRKGTGNHQFGKPHTEEYKSDRLKLWAKKNGHTWKHLETGETFWTKKEAKRTLGRYQTNKLIKDGVLIKVPYKE